MAMTEAQDGVAALLARIREGDREAAALFATRYAPMLRRRFAGQLGPRMRRIFDSHDLMSTVVRRFDGYVQRADIQARTAVQLRVLLSQIAQTAIIEKIRVVERLQRVEGPDSEVARMVLRRIESLERRGMDGLDVTVDELLARTPGRENQQLLWLWLAGRDLVDIAAYLGISPDAVYKRWRRLRRTLREAFPEEAGDDDDR